VPSAELYPGRGQPTLPPWKLAPVTVMPFEQDLSDRQAADSIRRRIDRTYALGLEREPTAAIRTAWAADGLVPGDHPLDAGSGDVEVRVGSQLDPEVGLVGAMRLAVRWPAFTPPAGPVLSRGTGR
jgi:hypothetical protein